MLRPEVVPFKNGVKSELKQLLSRTLTELLSTIDLTGVSIDSLYKFEYTYGLDGSGEHMNPNQLSKCHFSSSNVMSVGFTIKILLLRILDLAKFFTKVQC